MKKFFIVLILLFIGIQFIPYGRNHKNPPVVNEPNWDSPKTRQLFMKSCRDCHSNQTKWPWYSNVAPVSWIIYNHVKEGREHFNVSNWGHQEENEGEKAYKLVEKGKMPPFLYLLVHPEAKLTKEEKEELIKGLKNTFNK